MPRETSMAAPVSFIRWFAGDFSTGNSEACLFGNNKLRCPLFLSPGVNL
jgi:hypothetical protein